MAKRTVYICDGPSCGTVLVNPEDGFVILGAIRSTTLDGEAKALVSPPSIDESTVATETALCRSCLIAALGLHT